MSRSWWSPRPDGNADDVGLLEGVLIPLANTRRGAENYSLVSALFCRTNIPPELVFVRNNMYQLTSHQRVTIESPFCKCRLLLTIWDILLHRSRIDQIFTKFSNFGIFQSIINLYQEFLEH